MKSLLSAAALLAAAATLGAGCGSDSSGAVGGPGVTPGDSCATEGDERECARSNDYGTCTGRETCTDGKWKDCDAAEPAAETCNGADDNCNGETDEAFVSVACNPQGSDCPGATECHGEAGEECVAFEAKSEVCDLVDNDCDGEADEDFKDADGLYADPEHCGACNVKCEDLYPTAVTTACEVTIAGFPRCVVTECPTGTSIAPGGLGCVSLATRLCEPCTADADCAASLGDACVDYGGGSSFCGRDCSASSVFGTSCPGGFECVADQCVVAGGGSCDCSAGASFEKPCEYTDPAAPGLVCNGTQICSGGTLGDCTPPDEQCNGLDDDCDGVVDDGFVNATTGQYDDVHNCGACGIDCDTLFSDPNYHALGDCVQSGGEVPTCQPDCESGWADANQKAADGCECQIIQPNDDPPDVNGVDADCDGIDGQIPRGIFVSVAGDDSNPGTREQPVRHVQKGIDLAAASAQHDHVYVAEGVYEESIALASGESLFGGYSPDFSRHDPLGGTTILIGAPPTGALPGTVNAISLSGPAGSTRLDGFVIRASSQPTAFGNSYAVYVGNTGDTLTIRYNTIQAGVGKIGVQGANGADGQSAPGVAAPGAQARNAAGSLNCDNETSAGGAGVTHSCAVENGSPETVSGGKGGTADCPEMDIVCNDYNFPEPSGEPGVGPGGTGGPGGGGGYSSLQLYDNNFTCEIGYPAGCYVLVPQSPPAEPGATEAGLPGANGLDGASGAAGGQCVAGRGSVVGGEWSNALGTKGGGALPGGGGGGGGAGGGVAISACTPLVCACPGTPEVVGAGGGGGGAGGCGGFGGLPGASGGGAFGIFVTFDPGPPGSLPAILDNSIERGFGGRGGAGGAGGGAGAGSPGASGGSVPSSGGGVVTFAGPGGRGGDGGRGGFGGGGAGGCGGASIGIYFSDTGGVGTAGYLAGNTFPATGAPGAGGAGGPSLGNSGPSGQPGLYVEVSP